MASTVPSVRSSSCSSLPLSAEPPPVSSSVSVVAAAALSSSSSVSSAPPLTEARIRELFEEGVKLMDVGDFEAAFGPMSQAANAGLAEAQYNLGILYLHGNGVKQDRIQAQKLFTQAADAGIAAAQFNLGAIFYRMGTKQSDVKAVKLFLAAARQGFPQALGVLGKLYYNGKIFKKDNFKAVKFFARAASLGHAESHFLLGEAFWLGRGGLQRDVQKAAHHYKEAAKQGHPQALDCLASLLLPEVYPENIPSAIELFRRAQLNGGNSDSLSRFKFPSWSD